MGRLLWSFILVLLYIDRNHQAYWGRGAQDSHLDFHTAPELHLFSVALRSQRPYGVLWMGGPGRHLDFHTAPGLCSGVFSSSAVIVFASLALCVSCCSHRKLRVGAAKMSMLRGIAGSCSCPSPCPCTGTACTLSFPSLAEAGAGEARW